MKLWLKGGLYGIAIGAITLGVMIYLYLFSFINPLMNLFAQILGKAGTNIILSFLSMVVMDFIILFVTGIIVGLIIQIIKSKKKKEK